MYRSYRRFEIEYFASDVPRIREEITAVGSAAVHPGVALAGTAVRVCPVAGCPQVGATVANVPAQREPNGACLRLSTMPFQSCHRYMAENTVNHLEAAPNAQFRTARTSERKEIS